MDARARRRKALLETAAPVITAAVLFTLSVAVVSAPDVVQGVSEGFKAVVGLGGIAEGLPQ